MEKTIWKYKLEMIEKQFIKMPKGAAILAVQNQYDDPCLWAMVSPDERQEERCIEIFATGQEIPVGMGVSRIYISTFQLSGGAFVFHAFERLL